VPSQLLKKSIVKTFKPLAASLALLAALVAPAASHAAANLVVNGSFEQGPAGLGSFDGWTTTLGDDDTFVDSTGVTGPFANEASDGLWSAYFGTTAADGGATIAQSLATTAGASYVLSFDVANDNQGGAAANGLVASLAGASVFALSDAADQGYVHESISFVAGAAPTSMSFAAFNDTGWLQLDNVVVTAAAVPEPSAAQSMFTALLLASAFATWKRRARR
jgi:hypothetical protein